MLLPGQKAGTGPVTSRRPAGRRQRRYSLGSRNRGRGRAAERQWEDARRTAPTPRDAWRGGKAIGAGSDGRGVLTPRDREGDGA